MSLQKCVRATSLRDHLNLTDVVPYLGLLQALVSNGNFSMDLCGRYMSVRHKHLVHS